MQSSTVDYTQHMLQTGILINFLHCRKILNFLTILLEFHKNRAAANIVIAKTDFKNSFRRRMYLENQSNFAKKDIFVAREIFWKNRE